MFRLDGKNALVTGAATGLGAGIAKALATQGADLAISDLQGQSLAETAGEIRKLGRRAVEFEIDVREMEQLDRGVKKAREAFGHVDILDKNPVKNRPASGLQSTPSEWDDHYAINVKGGFFLAQKVAPMMIEQRWGRVIFISSQSGLVGIPGQPIYCSTKGAIIQAVRTLGLEWAKQGITVNSVAPTFVETNLTRKRLQNPEFLSFVLGKIPAGKLATTEDIGAAVAFLASEEAGMINCHTLSVDGGWTAW